MNNLCGVSADLRREMDRQDMASKKSFIEAGDAECIAVANNDDLICDALEFCDEDLKDLCQALLLGGDHSAALNCLRNTLELFAMEQSL